MKYLYVKTMFLLLLVSGCAGTDAIHSNKRELTGTEYIVKECPDSTPEWCGAGMDCVFRQADGTHCERYYDYWR